MLAVPKTGDGGASPVASVGALEGDGGDGGDTWAWLTFVGDSNRFYIAGTDTSSGTASALVSAPNDGGAASTIYSFSGPRWYPSVFAQDSTSIYFVGSDQQTIFHVAK